MGCSALTVWVLKTSKTEATHLRATSYTASPPPWKVFSYVQSEPSLFQFMSTASCPLPTHLSRQPDSIFSVMSSKKPVCCCLIPLRSPVSPAEQTYLPQPLLTGRVFQLPNHPGSPPLTSPLFINVFPVLRVPKLGTAPSREGQPLCSICQLCSFS